ncbi:hypothetical protein AAMO2058_001663000 [Amorphochlora amoebiformis]
MQLAAARRTRRALFISHVSASRFVRTFATGGGGPEKASLREDIASAYDPSEVETYWYEWWDREGYFGDSAAAGEKGITSMF